MGATILIKLLRFFFSFFDFSMSKHGKKRRAQNEKPAAKVPRKVEVVAPPPQVVGSD